SRPAAWRASSRSRSGSAPAPARRRGPPGGKATSFGPLALLQLAPEDLAGRRLRQLLDELHQARHLECRHAPPGPLDDLFRLQTGLARHDQRLDRFATVAVG